MKNQNQSSIQIATFSLPEFESEAKHTKNECLTKAESEAEILAAQNRPLLEESDMTPYVGEFNDTYDALKAKLKRLLLADDEIKQGSFDKQLSDEECEVMQRNRDKLKVEKIEKKKVLKSIILDFPWNKKRMWNIVVWCIAIVEGLFSISAFQLLISQVFSYLLGILFGLTLGAGAHMVPRLIRKGKNRTQQITIAIIVSVVTAILFYGLGVLRSKYFQTTGGMNISPLLFMVINLFFFGVASVIAFFNVPSPRQEIEKEQYGVLQKEVQDLELKISELEEKIAIARKHLGTKLQLRLQKEPYEKKMTVEIDRYKEQTFSRFKRVNLRGCSLNCVRLK